MFEFIFCELLSSQDALGYDYCNGFAVAIRLRLWKFETHERSTVPIVRKLLRPASTSVPLPPIPNAE